MALSQSAARTVQHRTVYYGQYSAVQYSTDSTAPYGTLWTVQYNTRGYGATYHRRVKYLYSIANKTKILHSTCDNSEHFILVRCSDRFPQVEPRVSQLFLDMFQLELPLPSECSERNMYDDRYE